jgi:5-methylcytosine-specific restriction protein A
MKKLCHCGAVKPCEVHRRRSTSKRSDHYDNQWRVLSERLRAHNPICEDCVLQGRHDPSTEVHHIVPINDAPQLRLVQSNLVCLCTSCHNERHRRINSGALQDDFSK